MLRPSILSPLNIVIFWWIGWGLLSMLSLTDLFVPSKETYVILSLFVASLFMGGKCVNFMSKAHMEEEHKSEIWTEKRLNLIFKVCAIFMLLILAFLMVKSVMLMNVSKTPTTYRFNAFSSADRVGMLFNHRLFENLYFLISSPILFFLALFGLVDFWKYTYFKKLSIAFVLNGMDAVIRLGRVNLYMMLILFFIVFLISEKKFMSVLKTKKKQILLVAMAFSCILYIGSQRGYSPSQQVKMFVVDYHTVGFTLFDRELKNKVSPLNTQTTYGRLTFGGLETVATIFIRQFDKSYYSPALENSINMSNHSVVVGIENPPTIVFNGIKVYNSFYTLLYTFYSDGGVLGIILGGLALGFCLEYFCRRWNNTKGILDAFFLILFLSISILSIFMSQLEVMRTWIIIIFLIYISWAAKRVDSNAA